MEPAGPDPVAPLEADEATDEGLDELSDDPVDAPPEPGLPEALPPVVAVMVTHDPGPWFEEVLQSLADQTYGALSVLVVDAASEADPTARIAEVLPGAYVRRLTTNPGFGAAANEALSAVQGASFFLFCHDDVALAPDAVRALVEESFRSNAGVAGPKLVAWDAPQQLRQVGASIDKAGVLAPFAEPGELDQEQHDAVRDVFVVPGACTLVRADLFRALEGYDAGIDYLGEDLDLCWRAHVAGARVLVVPAATVRHLEALGTRRPVDDRRRLQARHRLRTVMSCYRPFSLVRVLPQAFVFALVEALYALVAGHGRQAADVMGAWTWNLRRLGQVRRRRKVVKRSRMVPDHEVRELEVRGSARLTAFVRGQIGKGDDRLSAMTRSGKQFAGSLRARSSRASLIVGAITIAIVVLGTRNLFFRPIPAIDEFVSFPGSPARLVDGWLSSWRVTGLGREGPSPTGLGLLGGAGWLFLGATGLLRKVLLLGMLPVGLVGAWRLARPIGSLRAGIASVVVYAAIPVPYNAIASGTWGGLVLYAVAPWAALQLARATQLAPFGRADLAEGSPEAEATPRSRPVTRQIVALGVLVALAAAIVPFVAATVVLMALAMALGSLVAGRVGGLGRLALVTLGALALAFVMHLPWSADLLLPGRDWFAFSGVGTGQASIYSVGALLRFESGPFGAPPLGWAFLVAAALPIVIGRGWRFQWAVRGWFVALAGWGTLWAAQEGWLPVGLPAPEILLACSSAGLALATAMGMAAFEVDLPGYRFGWRQVVSAAAAVAVLVGILPLLGGVADGRWKIPGGSLDRPLSLVLARDGAQPSRVLWVGDPELVPVGGYRLDDHLTYATTGGLPAVADRWGGPEAGSTSRLGAALHLVAERRTTRLGALLAPMGVRYVVVPRSNAPTAYDGIVRLPPPAFSAALADQLDLARVDSDPALVVYRNTEWKGMVTSTPPGATAVPSFTDALEVPSTGVRPALHPDGQTSWAGAVRAGRDIVLAEGAGPTWKLQVGGADQSRRRAYGWANRFPVEVSGRASLRHDTPPLHLVLLGGQVLVWACALVALLRTSPARKARRERRRAAAGTDGTDEIDEALA